MKYLLLLFTTLYSVSIAAQEQVLQPSEAFQVTIDYQAQIVNIKIAPNHYLYANKLRLITPTGKIALQAKQQPIQFTDPVLKEQISIYRHQITIHIPHKDSTLIFQGCSDAGFCYPPISIPFKQSIWIGLFFTLLTAFIGGIILNFMPCILPILALKIRAIQSGTGGGIFYALGILSTTVTLGCIIALANLLGKHLNWGFYIQLPIIVSILIFIFLYLILMQFNIVKPLLYFHTKSRQGKIGDFLSGMMTIFVAGSCAAPFMAGAISSTLTHQIWEILLIFTMLGLGIATPIACFHFLPKSLHILPKPGRWQNILQHVISSLMAITLIWLIYVLISQTSYWIAIAIFASCFILSMACNYKKKILTGISILSILILSNIYGTSMAPADIQKQINEAISSHRGVFVNVTASWCITCKANEWHTLRRLEPKLAMHDIAYIKLDWSNMNQSIARFLSSFNRNSIPFYAYYPYNSRVPIILPQILQLDKVLSLMRID